MCLAIFKPADAIVDHAHLENGFEGNPHGAGFAVRQDDGTVLICKGFFDFKKFLAAYLLMSDNQTKQAIIHFRLATHGKQNPFNCHPWALGESRMVTIEGVPHAEIAPAAMVHNGILAHRSSDERSDTGFYVLDILDPLYRKMPGMIGDEIIRTLLGDHIGPGNKFCLMGGDGSYSIVNDNQGQWHNGAWFSNCGFRSSFARYSAWSTDEDWWPDGHKEDHLALPEDMDDSQPDVLLLPHEEETYDRLCKLFPEATSMLADPEEVLSYFRSLRFEYRRFNPDMAKATEEEIDHAMQTDGFADSIFEADGLFTR